MKDNKHEHRTTLTSRAVRRKRGGRCAKMTRQRRWNETIVVIEIPSENGNGQMTTEDIDSWESVVDTLLFPPTTLFYFLSHFFLKNLSRIF